MIETNLRSAERAPRMSASASQRARFAPTYRGAAAARSVPRYAPDVDLGSERAIERDIRVANGVRTQNRRLTRSEIRLLVSTVAFAVVFCGLLVVYLSAYARVTSLGIEQAQMRTQLHAERLTHQLLLAELASLKNPDRISAKAQALGLTKDASQIDYIALPAGGAAGPSAAAAPGASKTLSDMDSASALPDTTDSQVVKNGPITEDNYSARND